MGTHTKEYMREYREKHREKIREQQRVHNKNYYEKHKEEESLRCKVYRESNRDKVREIQKSWRERNKDYWKVYDANWYAKHRLVHRAEMWYWALHQRTQKLIRKLWIRPKYCPICWWGWRIEAHHPNYNEWNKIVFCCVSCHQLIHNCVIECPDTIILQTN